MLKTGLPSLGVSGKKGDAGKDGYSAIFGHPSDFFMSGLDYIGYKNSIVSDDEEDDYQKYLIRTGDKKAPQGQVYRRLYANPKDVKLFNANGTMRSDVFSVLRSKLYEWNSPNSPYYVYGYPYGVTPTQEMLIPIDGNPRHYFYSNVDFRAMLSKKMMLKPNIAKGDDLFVLAGVGLKKVKVDGSMEDISAETFNRILQDTPNFISDSIWNRNGRVCVSSLVGISNAGRVDSGRIGHYKKENPAFSASEFINILDYRANRFSSLPLLSRGAVADVDISKDRTIAISGSNFITLETDLRSFRIGSNNNGITLDVKGLHVNKSLNEYQLYETKSLDKAVSSETAKECVFPIDFDEYVTSKLPYVYEDKPVCKVGIYIHGDDSSISFAISPSAVSSISGGVRVMAVNTSKGKFVVQPTDFYDIAPSKVYTIKMKENDILELYRDVTADNSQYITFTIVPFVLNDGVRIFKRPIERGARVELKDGTIKLVPIQQFMNKSEGALSFVTDSSTLIDTSLKRNIIPAVDGDTTSMSDQKLMKIFFPTAKNSDGSVLYDRIVKVQINGVDVPIAKDVKANAPLYYADGVYSGVQKVNLSNITHNTFVHFRQPYYLDNSVAIPYIYGKNIPTKYANEKEALLSTNRFYQSIEEGSKRVLNISFTTDGGRTYDWSISQPFYEDERRKPTLSFEGVDKRFMNAMDKNKNLSSNMLDISNTLTFSNLDPTNWSRIAKDMERSQVYVATLCRLGNISPFMVSDGSLSNGVGKLNKSVAYGERKIVSPFIKDKFSQAGDEEPMQVSISLVAENNVIIPEGDAVRIEKGKASITEFMNDSVPFAILRDKNADASMSKEVAKNILDMLISESPAVRDKDVTTERVAHQIGLMSQERDMKNITSIATLGNGRYESGFFIIVSTMNYLVEHSEVNISLKLKMDNPTYADIELPISVDRMMFFSPSVDDGGSISFDPKYDVIKTFNYLNEEPVLMNETSVDLSSGITQESAMYGRYVKSSVVSSRGVYSVMPIEIGVNQLTTKELNSIPDQYTTWGDFNGVDKTTSIYIKPYLTNRMFTSGGTFSNEFMLPTLSSLFDDDTHFSIKPISETNKTLLTLDYPKRTFNGNKINVGHSNEVVYNGKVYKKIGGKVDLDLDISIPLFTEDELKARSFWNNEESHSPLTSSPFARMFRKIPSNKHANSNGYLFQDEEKASVDTAKKAKELTMSLGELKQQLTYKVVGVSEVKEDKIKGEVEISPYTIDLGEDYPVGPLINLERTRLSYKWRDNFTSSVTISPRIAQAHTGKGAEEDAGHLWVFTLRNPK
nr:MAG TPA: hypothetical protein [Caudoviricetes sp.]